MRAGEGIVVQLQEGWTAGERSLSAGALLYGAVRMNGNRLLVTFTAASDEEKRFPVSMTCYDTDLLPGIAFEGAGFWEKPRDQAMDRAINYIEPGVLKDLAQGAGSTYKAWRRKPQVRLENGRIVYVSALEK